MRGGGKEGDIGKTHAYDPAVLDVNLHLLLIVRDGGDGGVGGEHVSFWEGWRGRKMGELVGGMEGIWRGRRKRSILRALRPLLIRTTLITFSVKDLAPRLQRPG